METSAAVERPAHVHSARAMPGVLPPVRPSGAPWMEMSRWLCYAGEVRVLFCGSGWFPLVDHVAARLPEGMSIAIWDRAIPLPRAVREVNVILPSNGGLGAEAVAAARALVLIQQPAAGVDGIDLAAARARGIPVCNAPYANHVSVAETALFLLLALARRLPLARKGFAKGLPGLPLGRELRGKSLGIIGLGRSGKELAAIASGLGMQVRAVDSRSSRAAWQELYEGSDVISLHCPLRPDTVGLVGAEAFAAMKPGCLLVNCARGPIIDRAALDQALASGRLGGLGLDVYWHEPWDPDDPLFHRDDVVVLPHVAGSSEESFARIADIVVDNIARVARGDPPLHRVT